MGSNLAYELADGLLDLDFDHIEAILKTQYQLSDFYKEVFKEELKYRFEEKAEKL